MKRKVISFLVLCAFIVSAVFSGVSMFEVTKVYAAPTAVSTLPYTEDFDGKTYTVNSGVLTTSSIWFLDGFKAISTTGDAFISGSKSLKLYASKANSDPKGAGVYLQIDATNYTNLNLSFSYKKVFKSGTGGGDSWIEVSYDDGATYTKIMEFIYDKILETDSGFTSFAYQLDKAADNNSKIRVKLSTKNGNATSFYAVEDLKISTGAGTEAPAVTTAPVATVAPVATPATTVAPASTTAPATTVAPASTTAPATTVAPDSGTSIFTDLENYPWAVNEINFLGAKDIIYGISATTYGPGINVTRADFMAFLVRTLGLKAEFDTNFGDVNSSAKYYKELGIAKKLGIANGIGDNKYNPEAEISRQDLMVLTHRALKQVGKIKEVGTNKDIEKFSDKGGVNDYAVEGVSSMVKDGLIKGTGDSLNPKGNATRAETAVIMFRVYNK